MISLKKMYNVNSTLLIAIFIIFAASLVLIDKHEKRVCSVQYIFTGKMESRKLKLYEWGSDPKYTGTIYVSQSTLDVLNANNLYENESILYVSIGASGYSGIRMILPAFSNIVLCTDVHNITKLLCCPGWSLSKYCNNFNSMNMGDIRLCIDPESLTPYLDFHIKTYLRSNHIFADYAEKFQLDDEKSEIMLISEPGNKYKLLLKPGDMEKIGIIKTGNEVVKPKTTTEKLRYSVKTMLFFDKLNNDSVKLYFFNSMADKNGRIDIDCKQFVCTIISSEDVSGKSMNHSDESEPASRERQ